MTRGTPHVAPGSPGRRCCGSNSFRAGTSCSLSIDLHTCLLQSAIAPHFTDCKLAWAIGWEYSVVLRYLCLLGALAPTVLSNTIETASMPRYFGGYKCTDRCRQHAEGFRWARESRVREGRQCEGPSTSHIQGCLVYLRDRMRDATRDDNGGLIE